MWFINKKQSPQFGYLLPVYFLPLIIYRYIFSFSEQAPVTTSETKQTVKENASPKLLSCRQRPEYRQRPNITLDQKTVDGVETLLMFLGYARSGHTLISSLLDAHPNMVIANEYYILKKWQTYAEENKNKQYLFQQLYINSYREANYGDRSLANCAPVTKYKYVVPNQWQGNFNGKIKVGVRYTSDKCISKFTQGRREGP